MVAVHTTKIPMTILDFLGFPIELSIGRCSGAVVVYKISVLKGTQKVYTTSTQSCFFSRNMFARWRSISEIPARWWCIYLEPVRRARGSVDGMGESLINTSQFPRQARNILASTSLSMEALTDRVLWDTWSLQPCAETDHLRVAGRGVCVCVCAN